MLFLELIFKGMRGFYELFEQIIILVKHIRNF